MCKALDIAKSNNHRFPKWAKIKHEVATTSIGSNTFLSHYSITDCSGDDLVGWLIYELSDDSYKITHSGWHYQ